MDDKQIILGPNQKKWLAALRSGDYAQTRESLQDTNGFCCLGVACDISGVGSWSEDTVDFSDDYTFQGTNSDVANNNDLADTGVDDWLGLNTPDGDPKDGSELYSLVVYNDSGDLNLDMDKQRPFTFNEIADLLEANPNEFFSESK